MPGGCLSSERAQVAGKELVRIQKEHGCVRPELVVDESRPDTAPLHEEFTWDDSVAGENWRLEEARRIIRSVRIISPDMPPAEQPVIRAFLNVTATDTEKDFEGQAYLSYPKIRKSPDYRQQVLNQAMNELNQWKQRYQDYKDTFLSNVFDAIETVEAEFAK